MIKDTVCEGCKYKECPNKIESYWKDAQTGELKVVTDCAPKRSMMMIQDMSTQLVSQQAAIEQLRNENHDIKKQLECANNLFLDSSNQVNKLLSEVGQITQRGIEWDTNHSQ